MSASTQRLAGLLLYECAAMVSTWKSREACCSVHRSGGAMPSFPMAVKPNDGSCETASRVARGSRGLSLSHGGEAKRRVLRAAGDSERALRSPRRMAPRASA